MSKESCLDCALCDTCEKAKHFENYSLDGCSSFTPKQEVEYINKAELINKVCEEYRGAMTGFFMRPNDFLELVDSLPVYHLNN